MVWSVHKDSKISTSTDKRSFVKFQCPQSLRGRPKSFQLKENQLQRETNQLKSIYRSVHIRRSTSKYHSVSNVSKRQSNRTSEPHQLKRAEERKVREEE